MRRIKEKWYGKSNLLKYVKYEDGSWKKYRYDKHGNETWFKSSSGDMRKTKYDKQGHKVSEWICDERIKTHIISYFQEFGIIEIIKNKPLNKNSPISPSTKISLFNTNGDMIYEWWKQDGINHWESYVYDIHDDTIISIDMHGNKTECEYIDTSKIK